MWRRIAPAERDATATRVTPPPSRAALRAAIAVTLLALPLLPWLARHAGWTRLGDALALVMVVAALAALARAIGGVATALFLALAGALLGLGHLAGVPAVYGPTVAINFAVAALFGVSWWRGDPLVTRFARLEGSAMSPDKERYCRRLTLVWALYLVGLALIGIGLALHGDERWGAWWSGAIDYLLVAALFVGELVYRQGSVRGVVGQMRTVRNAMRKPSA